VTLLFTDVEGSTRLLDALGPSYAAALAAHREVLRRAVRSQGGHEVDATGDAFLAAFSDAGAALEAAIHAQRELGSGAWSDGISVRVRMGVHTGRPELTGEGYVGRDVHLGARVCDAAHGGQVLVTESTVHAAGSVATKRLGVHRLKDFREPVALHQLLDSGLETDFPPVRARIHRPASLPEPLTDLVGRSTELAELRGLLLGPSRLVTVTGPGGSGKTRVALQLASDVADELGDGVVLVDLGSADDAEQVPGALAQALGVVQRGGRPLRDALVRHLADREVLLVLDNFEQVLGAGPIVSDVLRACTGVRALVTSREPLRVPGEQEYPLPPLAVPEPGAGERAGEWPAVRLFVERARASSPRFTLEADDLETVASICRRLDGLPLAIELAAARVKVLDPPSLLSRLESGLAALSTRRSGPARQQTLVETIRWSHALLTASEQDAFARLCVFEGGAGLAEAEAVLGGTDRAVDLVGALVDKNMLRRIDDGHGARFGMLVTIRDFGLARLAGTTELTEMRAAHARCFEAAAARYSDGWKTGAPRSWWFVREHDNLVQAVHEVIATGDTDRILAIATHCWRAWAVTGRLRDGLDLVGRVLDATEGVTSRDRLELQVVLGEFRRFTGDLEGARRVKEAALEELRSVDVSLAASTLDDLADIAVDQGRFADAHRLADEAMDMMRAVGNLRALKHSLAAKARASVFEGCHEEGHRIYHEVQRRAEAVGDWEAVTEAHLGIGHALAGGGEVEAAAQRARAAADLASRHQDRFHAVDAAGLLAILADRRGDRGLAARFLGYVDEACEVDGFRSYFPDHRESLRWLAQAEPAAHAEGRRLTIADISALAALV
jgi:predicted ATPase/class 3 adenylate cyclase